MHRQITQRLRDALAAGRYAPGQRLPTEQALMRTYRVSRITARQALQNLVREGRVVRRQGKGTFAATPVVRHDLLDMRGIYDEMVSQGLRPNTRLLAFSRVVAPARVAERLGSGGQQVFRWKRLYSLAGKPFGVSVVHLHSPGARLTREQAGRYPTYSILESILGYEITRADIGICYRRGPADVARHLGLGARGAVMRLERVSYSSDGMPREHSLFYTEAGAYEFSVSVRGKIPLASSFKGAVE